VRERFARGKAHYRSQKSSCHGPIHRAQSFGPGSALLRGEGIPRLDDDAARKECDFCPGQSPLFPDWKCQVLAKEDFPTPDLLVLLLLA
jgi:hypothetical protein